MPMKKVSRSSVIFRSTLHLTVQMHGRIRNCSSLTRTVHRWQWQDARRMLLQLPDSSGAIRCIAGITTQQTGYVWWISRLRHCFTLYDVVRVDHFRGFDEYYAIPYGDKTAENGVWKKGPGIDLFHTVKKELGDVNIIAEDLGYLTESVMKLVEDTGYPGMKVLQFAFDSREESNYLPHNYPHNCVVYTGTHDNNTVRGWLDDMCEEDNALAEDYMNNADTPKDERPWEFIRLALGSVADLAVIPLQDYLCLGTEARINLPSTLGNNWKWRLVPGQVTDEMLEKMCHLNKLFGRL